MLENISEYINSLTNSVIGNELSFISLGIYFISGFLASLFPCVYPLYPITAGFLREQSAALKREWVYPFIYCLGIVFTYMILGSIAVASGGAFNRWMQNGVVITLIGFSFLYLAFICLDWASLDGISTWAGKWQQRAAAHINSIFIFLMGNLAGLIASACVAPILVSMLLLLAQNAASEGLGARIGQGALLCGAFGSGIALPLFIVGVFGIRLPRTGYWQVLLKYVFAVGIAFTALYQIMKGFETLGFEEMNIYMIVSGIILLFLALLAGLNPIKAYESKKNMMRFYFALLFLVFATGLIWRALLFPTSPARTTSFTSTKEEKALQQYEQIADLRFFRNYDYALELAKKSGNLPVFIDFYADWCANCKEFSRLLKKNERLQRGLRKAVLLKIYDTDPIFKKLQEDKRFPELKIGLPFFAVLEADGRLRWKTTNYLDTSGMLEALDIKGN